MANFALERATKGRCKASVPHGGVGVWKVDICGKADYENIMKPPAACLAQKMPESGHDGSHVCSECASFTYARVNLQPMMNSTKFLEWILQSDEPNGKTSISKIKDVPQKQQDLLEG